MASPKNNDEIVPDVPQMRSVLIRSAQTPAFPMRSGLEFTAKSESPCEITVSVGPSISSRGGSTWRPHNIAKLPAMYPLERSHVSIPNADATEIAQRISECLRMHSISASFIENKAVAETACHTLFYVKLFEDDDHVIVEVQRRSGCSYKFMECSRTILRAAQGQNFIIRRQIPRWTVPDEIQNEDEISRVNNEAIDRSFELLKSIRIDSQLLGMQNLVKLSENVELGDRLKSVIAFISQVPKDDDSFAIMLRRDALIVLANSLSLRQPYDLVSEELLRTLIADLTNQDLHSAHQAARCLTSICQEHRFKTLIDKMGALSASLMARANGSSHHLLLEQEARLLHMALEG